MLLRITVDETVNDEKVDEIQSVGFSGISVDDVVVTDDKTIVRIEVDDGLVEMLPGDGMEAFKATFINNFKVGMVEEADSVALDDITIEEMD